MDNLDALLSDIESGNSLEHYAAHAAAKELVTNWKAAMRDGLSIAEIVGDVDRTIAVLAKFKTDTAMGVIKFEDCRILTDRWGEVMDLDPPATDAQRRTVEKLLPCMWDELTFIAERDGASGILFESEYDDGLMPTDADVEHLAEIHAAHPYAQCWFTQGGHTFGERYALRVFVPEEHATPERSDLIGRQILHLHYGPHPTKAIG